MKKLLVVFLAVAMIFAFAATALAADTEIPDYTDMAGQKAEWESAVYRLTALGVLEGNTGVGGAFRPADYITRAELAKLVIYLTGNTDKVAFYAAQAPAYTDVVDGFWAEGYINACKDLGGLMKGVGYGKFNPQGTVSFQETATVVLRALNYDDNLKGEWPADYSRKAAEIKLIKYVDYIGPKAITRAELASIFNEGLDKLMVTYIADSTAQGLGQFLALTAAQIEWYFDEDDLDGVDLTSFGVDADGFAYNIFYTNQDKRTANSDLLAYAFDATAGEVQFYDGGQGRDNDTDFAWYSEANAWGYDDFDDGELIVASYDAYYADDYEDDMADHSFPDNEPNEDEVASSYYIFGGGLPDLANMQAEVTYNEDGEVLFVGMTSQKVKVDSWKGDGFDCFGEANGSKLTVGDVKYKVNTKKGYQLNDSAINVDDINAEGGFGYLFLDEDGNAYDFKEYYQFADDFYLIFSKIDDNYIYYINDGSERISKLDDYVLLKDGEFAELADLEKGDVLYYDYLYDGDVELWIAISPIEGGDLTKGYTGGAYGFTVDDTRYFGLEGCSWFSLDALDNLKAYDDDTVLRDEFFEEEVVYAPAYAWRDFVYVHIDIESYNYGVIDKLKYNTNDQDTNILAGVNIKMADGEVVSYTLDKEFFNSIGGLFFDVDDNEEIWTKGSLVEFQLNKDGEIQALKSAIGNVPSGAPNMWFRGYGDTAGSLRFARDNRPFISRYDRNLDNSSSSSILNLYPGVNKSGSYPGVPYANYNINTYVSVDVGVDEDDSEITFGGETYKLAADAEIFAVSLSGKDYDKTKILAAEDLLADGDFSAWQIAAVYTTGRTIDTLWIVGRDVKGDVDMGYITRANSYDADHFNVKLNGVETFAREGFYMDPWVGAFSAYIMDGDTIDNFKELIVFDTDALEIMTPTVTNYGAFLDSLNTLPDGGFDYFAATGNYPSNFVLKDDDTTYNITVGVLADDPNPSVKELVLTNSWNGSNDDTYFWYDSTIFTDLDGSKEYVDDMDEDDTVVIVRNGAKVVYVFRLYDYSKHIV